MSIIIASAGDQRWLAAYFTFACGDGNVCDQGVQFVGGVLILVTLPGQPYAYPVRHVPAIKNKVNVFSKMCGAHYSIIQYRSGQFGPKTMGYGDRQGLIS